MINTNSNSLVSIIARELDPSHDFDNGNFLVVAVPRKGRSMFEGPTEGEAATAAAWTLFNYAKEFPKHTARYGVPAAIAGYVMSQVLNVDPVVPTVLAGGLSALSDHIQYIYRGLTR